MRQTDDKSGEHSKEVGGGGGGKGRRELVLLQNSVPHTYVQLSVIPEIPLKYTIVDKIC